jgi:hypothetical protein
MLDGVAIYRAIIVDGDVRCSISAASCPMGPPESTATDLLWPQYSNWGDLEVTKSVLLTERELPESSYAVLKQFALWRDRIAVIQTVS